MAKWAGSLSATTPSKSKMIARSIVGHKSSETHPRTFEGSTRRIVESVKRGGIIAQASTRETFRGRPAGPSWLRLQPLFLNPALSSIFSPDRIDPCVVPELTVDHGHRGARADGEAAAGSPCFNGEWDRSGRESRIGKHHDALPFNEERRWQAGCRRGGWLRHGWRGRGRRPRGGRGGGRWRWGRRWQGGGAGGDGGRWRGPEGGPQPIHQLPQPRGSRPEVGA